MTTYGGMSKVKKMKTGMGLHKSFFPKSKKNKQKNKYPNSKVHYSCLDLTVKFGFDVLAAEFITTMGTKAVIDG